MTNIPTVDVVKGSVEEQALKQQFGDQIGFNYGQNQFAGADRNATNTQYIKYLKSQGINPTNTNVDLNSIRGVNVANGVLADAKGNPVYDSQSEMANMTNQLGQIRDTSVQQQKAQLDAMLATQINQLGKAYEQAISDGKISVRDAQDAFLNQKALLEKQAYQDAERTALTSQDLGIQNSQQMLGLQAGDNARNASLNNSNMTQRDKQIANITERLNSIKNANTLDLINARAQYDSGLLKANADANTNYMNGVFSMRNDNLNANRAQQFQKDNMATQNDYQLGQMAKANEYDLAKMDRQQILDFAKMDKQFAQSLQLENIQASHAQALQNARTAAERASANDNYNRTLQASFSAYGVDPNAPDALYQLRIAQNREPGETERYNAEQEAKIKADAEAAAIPPVDNSPDPFSSAVDRFLQPLINPEKLW